MDLLQILRLTAETFREEHFKNFAKASEELEKRAHTLSLLKKAQKMDLDEMNSSKEELRLKAEHLAEKYEDIKDKQDELLKRFIFSHSAFCRFKYCSVVDVRSF